MSKYLERQANHLGRLKALAESNENPHHRGIIENFVRHSALEIGFDRWEEIFDPKYTVENPSYMMQILGATEPVFYEGADAVKKFYADMAAAGALFTNDFHVFAVADWGFAIHEDDHFFNTGAELQAAGVEVDDPEATYAQSMHLAGFWHFDDQARLWREEIYQLCDLKLSKVDPADVFTREQLLDVVRPFQPAVSVH